MSGYEYYDDMYLFDFDEFLLSRQSSVSNLECYTSSSSPIPLYCDWNTLFRTTQARPANIPSDPVTQGLCSCHKCAVPIPVDDLFDLFLQRGK